jgi:prepilin-type N-terminal cleavage/methylation domain-containing protein
MTRQAGFTLLELLLSVAIIGMLTGLSVPIYASFAKRNDLDLIVQNTASAIRRSEAYATAVRSDSTWGVRFDEAGITLFKGASYVTRDAAFDETIAVPGSVSVSGMTEVQFAKLSAEPSATGSVTFTNDINDTRTLTLNAKGMVNY